MTTATTHEQRIVKFLSSKQAYAHPVGEIDRRETHVSHVFLAGDYAYKMKKAVNFPFLVATELSQREHFCELELTLNRRLAPDIYLDKVPIVETPEGLQIGGKGKTVEWVVKMNRLPDGMMLDQLMAKKKVVLEDMQNMADRLMPFFKKAERGAAIDAYGTPEKVAELVLGNVAECEMFLGTLLDEADKRFIVQAYKQFLVLHQDTLAKRVNQKRIIDGHGDLRCENICMTDPVNIFDCVEFQPAFRCGDVLNDLSFLVMDLEFRGQPELGDVLVERYRSAFKDTSLDKMLPFYKCHRSLVRGKVRGFAWDQLKDTPEGKRIKTLSRKHFKLGRQYAEQFSQPRLILVGGLIGSGKSTLGGKLADAFGAEWLRSDEIRIKEFGEHRSDTNGFSNGLYAPQVSDKVYKRMISKAEKALRAGQSVVCDATFSKVEGRVALHELATKHGASFHFFECTVPKAVALERIAKRAAEKSDISEAKPEHYDRLKKGYEPVEEFTAEQWTKLSDNRAAEETYAAALRKLRRLWA